MKKQKKLSQQGNGKIIKTGIVIFIIILVIFIGVKAHKSSIQKKLTGTWNIELENSSWARAKDYKIGTIMNIKTKNIIELPPVYNITPFVFKDRPPLDSLEEEITIAEFRRSLAKVLETSKGIWQIISTNPDSVFFNVPKNPLYGKYAVRFFIDKKGWVYANMRNNILKIELKNDSTYLICNKSGAMFKSDVQNWEGKN